MLFQSSLHVYIIHISLYLSLINTKSVMFLTSITSPLLPTQVLITYVQLSFIKWIYTAFILIFNKFKTTYILPPPSIQVAPISYKLYLLITLGVGGAWNAPAVLLVFPTFDDTSSASGSLSPWFHPGWLPPIYLQGNREAELKPNALSSLLLFNFFLSFLFS